MSGAEESCLTRTCSGIKPSKDTLKRKVCDGKGQMLTAKIFSKPNFRACLKDSSLFHCFSHVAIGTQKQLGLMQGFRHRSCYNAFHGDPGIFLCL